MNEFAEDLQSGFFDEYLKKDKVGLVGENGKLDLAKMEDLYDWLGKWGLAYFILHGEIVPTWNVPDKFKGSESELYRYLVEHGESYTDLFGEQKSNILL